jgi:hypothetical protein
MKRPSFERKKEPPFVLGQVTVNSEKEMMAKYDDGWLMRISIRAPNDLAVMFTSAPFSLMGHQMTARIHF